MDLNGQVPSVIQAAYITPVLSGFQLQALNTAKEYAMQQSVHNAVQKQNLTPTLQPSLAGFGIQTTAVQRQQALVLMCRVYVGSIFYDVREEIVRNAFTPFGPIKSINMSFDPVTGKHKGFAFIEYETPDSAQLALEQMTSAHLAGRSIRVGRPSNMPQSHPLIDKILEESKTQKRIYVAAVHGDLTVTDLKSVFSAFGNILSCNLAPDPLTGKHKGYGWIEFSTLQSAHDAISSMNNFDIGGQYLKVGRAIAPPGATLPVGSSFNNNSYSPSSVPAAQVASPPNAVARGRIGGKPTNVAIPPPGVAIPQISPKTNGMSKNEPHAIDLPNTISSEENFNISGTGARRLIMQKLMRPEESRVMLLIDMVDVSEVDESLEAEVTEECMKYGDVARVIIYQERQGEEETAPVLVKIFVEFKEAMFAAKAIDSLNGRWFGGNKIKATCYSQQKFDGSDFSG